MFLRAILFTIEKIWATHMPDYRLHNLILAHLEYVKHLLSKINNVNLG